MYTVYQTTHHIWGFSSGIFSIHRFHWFLTCGQLANHIDDIQVFIFSLHYPETISMFGLEVVCKEIIQPFDINKKEAYVE